MAASPRAKPEPSSRATSPPSVLTCLHDFTHVSYRPNLEDVAILQRGMLRHELYRLIHVPRFQHENAAELFFRFRVRAVRGCDFAVFPIQGQRGFRRLQPFSTIPMPVSAKMIVILKAGVEHGIALGLSHAVEFIFVVITETHVFHSYPPIDGAGSTALTRRIRHPIVVAPAENRQPSRPNYYSNSWSRLRAPGAGTGRPTDWPCETAQRNGRSRF